MRWIWRGALVLLTVVVVGFALLGWRSGRGGISERLAPCGEAPNCVSTGETRESHRVEPIAFADDSEAAFERALAAVNELPGARVVVAEDGYIHAECRSRIFRFVDDLELQVDAEAGLIRVRSASRVGYSDMGVNRRRVESLRAALEG